MDEEEFDEPDDADVILNGFGSNSKGFLVPAQNVNNERPLQTQDLELSVVNEPIVAANDNDLQLVDDAMTVSQPATPKSFDSDDVFRLWNPNELVRETIHKGPKGVGMKLKERNGRVYVTHTTKGSPSERVLGSTKHLGPEGLRIVSVNGVQPEGKAECVAAIKASSDSVEVEVVLEPFVSEDAGAVAMDESPRTDKQTTVKVRKWEVGQSYIENIPKISLPKGGTKLGLKLDENESGHVFILSTKGGSPAREVLGSLAHLGSRKLRIVKVQDTSFMGKSECSSLLHAAPSTVVIELMVEHTPINMEWPVGIPQTVSIRRSPHGLGVKLGTDDDGTVRITSTVQGSTSEAALGSSEHLGPQGLRVLKVFEEAPTSKAECVNLLKQRPEETSVEVEFIVDPVAIVGTSTL